DGVNTISEPILHCFGQGTAGQTYMLKHEGSFYESRVSFYNDIKGLDITLGYPRTAPSSLKEALGRLTGPDEARSCYGCHATAATSGMQLQLETLMPGVSCEACHGPGEKHLAAMKSGNAAEKSIFNPATLSGDELTQEFCAACHRSAEDVALMPDQAGINNVRFQPYRIFNSPCYADDKRISCTACHNPHQELKRDVSFYDAKCLACHTAKPKLQSAQLINLSARVPAEADDKQFAATVKPCPVETKNCASCHMPKVELPGAHTKFTDHRIRVVRPNEAFPK
ncbi:MAG: multiheme c-type cytochrome, partial [Pyrinomonadaceae bacterium]